MGRPWRFTEEQVRVAVGGSRSFAEALRRLGLGPSGGNWRTLQRRCREWGISTEHFDPYASSRGRRGQVPLEAVLVRGSTYSRWHLKQRLFEQGLKSWRCELCGQGEEWRGRPMALIIDHVNGVRNDHRLENLRIVCLNCAATLDTHCGRRNRLDPKLCEACRREFAPRSARQRFCSRPCAARRERPRGPRPELRKVVRPPHAELVAEVRASSWSAVARRYGVSDNAVRKWVKDYESARRSASGLSTGAAGPG